ncbi:MAG TPA: fused MFS/spermidine synthase [Gemmatimonadales bacterium]|nr:fused MFS/spermidine synthase [Gemmatimonadales bacterium]
MRSSATRAYAILFFLSGTTGLVYELLWVRVLYQTFGSTIQAVTTVVAAYMGGLGLGAWLVGRWADRHPRPAALYGLLEIAIGACGVLSPLVLELAHRAYLATAASLGPGSVANGMLRFALAALVLLVPTSLMGGTLPVLTRAFTGADRRALPHSLGLLYGLNTLGAVVGTALAGFVLIEFVGIRTSLWGTAGVNVALGAAALALAPALAYAPEPRAVPAAGPAAVGGPAVAPGAGGALRRVALILLALTAFAALLDEIAWTRVLVMIVGASTYAFTLVLLVFLLGIGLGSGLVARRGAASPAETAAAAAGAQAVTALGAALLFVEFAVLPRYIIAVFQVEAFGAVARLAAMGLAVGAVVFVPAIGMGMTFPLLTDLVASADAARGADVGRAYAVNTLGGIAGAVVTGFVLVATLGTDRTLRLGVVVNVLAALGLAAFAARGVAAGAPQHRRLGRHVVAAGALASLALGAALAVAPWSTRLVDLGPSIYAREPMDASAVAEFLAHRGSRQRAYREGWNATVSVWEGVAGRALKVNGKADASDYADMDTQVMLGLAPVAAHPQPKSAFVVGYGSGATAGVLAAVPGMARVRVSEIEPAVLAMSRFFLAVNDSVLERPNVSVVVDDARSALQLDPARYDVVVSEPSNPWLAGVATLYTPEFFQIARRHLADGGVFCQWVQLYQLPLAVVAGIVRNIRSVFPHVQLWFGSPGDVIVIASAQALVYDAAWLRGLVGPGGALARWGREYLGVDQPADYFGHLLLGEAGVAALLERPSVVHRDDRPRLEFVAARRFFDREEGDAVFDSLADLRAASATADRLSPLLFARALTLRRGDPAGQRYVEAARRAQPGVPAWTVAEAAILIGLGDTTFADSVLPPLVHAGGEADAAFLAGLVAARRGQDARARALLDAALAGGADTAAASAALAALDARATRWAAAAAHTRAALAAAHATLRHPYPRDWLAAALTPFALAGPPGVADSLLVIALRSRDGWFTLHELRAVAALRAGHCAVAAEEFEALREFGIERADAPAWLERCRRGVVP